MAVIALCGLLLMFLACAQFSSLGSSAQAGKNIALHNPSLYTAIVFANGH